MFDDPKGPIEHFSWASFVIAGKRHAVGDGGKIGAGKDVRVIGLEVSAWKERHGHLLTPEMITGVYGKGIEILVIGNGVDQALKCPAKVVASIQTQDIPEVIIEATPKACKTYNRLYHSGKKVALLAHGTC
jgi:hypothetical protein